MSQSSLHELFFTGDSLAVWASFELSVLLHDDFECIVRYALLLRVVLVDLVGSATDQVLFDSFVNVLHSVQRFILWNVKTMVRPKDDGKCAQKDSNVVGLRLTLPELQSGQQLLLSIYQSNKPILALTLLRMEGIDSLTRL